MILLMLGNLTFIGALMVSASALSAPDIARSIVERGIKAQGGEAQIAKLRIMRIKVEGVAVLIPGQPGIPFSLEDIWRMPDRYKSSSEFQMPGRKISQTQAIVGDTGWIQMTGPPQDLPPEAVAEMKEQKYAEDLDRCGFLAVPGVELSAIDPTSVDGKPAEGVLIKSKGHREVKLYFDRESGLLVKREHRLLDPSLDKEVLQEVFFSDYQEQDGLKHYRKIIVLRDGKKVFDAVVIELEFFKTLGEKVFAKP